MTFARQTCEDLEDAENLRHLFAIMRGAIMLNDTSLLETLLADDAVMVPDTNPSPDATLIVNLTPNPKSASASCTRTSCARCLQRAMHAVVTTAHI